ncbi:hypothetical protein ACMFMF_001045 [Clarireedia jacksonii]
MGTQYYFLPSLTSLPCLLTPNPKIWNKQIDGAEDSPPVSQPARQTTAGKSSSHFSHSISDHNAPFHTVELKADSYGFTRIHTLKVREGSIPSNHRATSAHIRSQVDPKSISPNSIRPGLLLHICFVVSLLTISLLFSLLYLLRSFMPHSHELVVPVQQKAHAPCTGAPIFGWHPKRPYTGITLLVLGSIRK